MFFPFCFHKSCIDMHVNKMKFKRKTSLSIITFTILGKQNKLKRSITSHFSQHAQYRYFILWRHNQWFVLRISSHNFVPRVLSLASRKNPGCGWSWGNACPAATRVLETTLGTRLSITLHAVLHCTYCWSKIQKIRILSSYLNCPCWTWWLQYNRHNCNVKFEGESLKRKSKPSKKTIK